MKTQYIIAVHMPRGLEEYDGGYTLADARKEAGFFVENTPSHVRVAICRVNKEDRLVTLEVARG